MKKLATMIIILLVILFVLLVFVNQEKKNKNLPVSISTTITDYVAPKIEEIPPIKDVATIKKEILAIAKEISALEKEIEEELVTEDIPVIVEKVEEELVTEDIPVIVEEELLTEDIPVIVEELLTEDIPVIVEEVSLKTSLAVLSAKVGDPIFIRIFKNEAILEVWIQTGLKYTHLKDYKICSFSGNLGPKVKQGDYQAPEGFYTVKKRSLNPNSSYHLSFNLGYPNKYDKAYKRTGSYLMVHGNCISAGCYAMTDDKIEEIYSLVAGAVDKKHSYIQVHAYPFRMTDENLDYFKENKWYGFWKNLKEGYDYFEENKLPPTIDVSKKRYVIKD